VYGKAKTFVKNIDVINLICKQVAREAKNVRTQLKYITYLNYAHTYQVELKRKEEIYHMT